MKPLSPEMREQQAIDLYQQYRQRLASFSPEQLAQEPSVVDALGQIVRWQDRLEDVAALPDTTEATRVGLYNEIGVATIFSRLLRQGAAAASNGSQSPQ